MLEMDEFRKKLTELCALAAGNQNCLSGDQVRTFFNGLELSREQLLHIFKYLKAQGIMIEGISFGEEAAEETVETTEPLLGEEEAAYLKAYLSSLEQVSMTQEELEEWFEKLQQGEEAAKEMLTKYYLPIAAQIAVTAFQTTMQLADLIQEANVCLLLALTDHERVKKDDVWLKEQITTGIREVAQEQSRQKFEDECLVARVEKLESAVKDLSEDEDGEKSSFSVNELAIILDMEVEEIEDVLRLTGDL